MGLLYRELIAVLGVSRLVYFVIRYDKDTDIGEI
jgi:hypothetical protein